MHGTRNKKINQRDRDIYDKMVKDSMPKNNFFVQLLKAFIVGGIICAIGQGVNDFGTKVLMLGEEGVSSFTAIVMVFLGATLTGIGVYDKIGNFAGAGSIVPITGFANSIVAPAMEFKREGFVMGVGARMFSLAGPVLVFGITASIIYGLLLVLFGVGQGM